MAPIVSIRNLTKVYGNGFQALKGVDLEIEEGEILALLGPNGAGKTTLISIVCGLVNPSGGQVLVGGNDVVKDFRKTRAMIGLVPQELTTDQFETVWNTVTFSRGVHGKKADPARIEAVLKDLSLWEKRNNTLRELSGGMKRRVLIAKALAHDPREMWQVVEKLRQDGVTIILTTHYIEEAEEIADRVGVISGGELLLVEAKAALMKKLGRKELRLELTEPMTALPEALGAYNVSLAENGGALIYEYQGEGEQGRIAMLLGALTAQGIEFRDLSTRQSSLEDIFVELVEKKA